MTGLDDIPLLETITEEGKAPKERLKDASVGRSIFVGMRDDDLVNAANRAEHQALLDNEPPYVESELREANMSGMTNLNFGGSEETLEKSMAPYYRLVMNPENLVDVKTLFGAVDERADFNAILSEEISTTIRTSEMFTFQTLLYIQKFIKDGLGVGFFPDEIDWRYRGAGLGQFYFDRQTFASESEQEIVCATEEYRITRLYKAIENHDEDSDWDKDAVIAAILKAATTEADFENWELLQEELKNNDIYASRQCPPVTIVHMWVHEFNGEWSHYMFTEVDTGNPNFLYKSLGKHKSLSEALVIFPYGLGTNAKIHGMRGLMFKIYPHEQQRNRSLSRLIDQGILASSLMLQAEDENALNTTGLQYLGNTAVLGPEWKVTNVVMPDLQRSVMPSIEVMDKLRADRSAGYNSDAALDGDQRKTKFEVAAGLEQSAGLSDAALDFFYNPFERLARQSVRRIANPSYLADDPGGEEVEYLKARLKERGVPVEALYGIDHKATTVVRAIGAGSAAAKTISLSRMEDLRPRMDDVGQENLDRDLSVDAVGSAATDRFFPKDRATRTTLHTNVAILENAQLLAGVEIPVLPSDRDLAHAREHIKPLMDGFEEADQNPDILAEMALRLRLLYVHCATHVDALEGDPAVEAEAAMMREQMQHIGEVISNGMKQAEAEAEDAAQEEGDEEQQGPDPDQVREFEKHRQKMNQAQEMFALKMEQAVVAADVKNDIKDAEAASGMARSRKVQKAQPTTTEKP
jgi:hypothetical protein